MNSEEKNEMDSFGRAIHNRKSSERTFRKLTTAIKPSCSKKTLYRRLPVLRWMTGYNGNLLVSDMLAGLTVGLTAIPQGIAYAAVAGLEPQYGLYSGFMGCFVYFLLGSVKDVTIGPTAIMALMAQKSVESCSSDFAVLLCFLAGCIILLFGVFHLGFLVSFISVPVTLGFTTAAAITIASSQTKGLLGITGKSDGFLESWKAVFEKIGETKYQDLILGLVTIFFLVMSKYLNDKISQYYKNQTNVTTSRKVFKETVRVLALGRNAVAVALGALAAYLFELNGMTPFRLTGDVKGGLPKFSPPPFSTSFLKNNVTKTLNFEEMVGVLGTSIISVPVISVLETIAIAKAFAKGQTLDATQEMIALGASNIAGSFFRSMPTAGSFTRTAVNNASGVRTPLGGLFTGALVLSAFMLTATFKYIPKATLAAVIVTAMFYMIECHEIKAIWRVKRLDFIPLTATILGCLLLGLDFGIIIGVFINLLFILFYAVRPKLSREEPMVLDNEVLVVRPEQTISYPGAEYVRDYILKESKAKPRRLVIVDGRNMNSIDMTTAKNFKTLSEDFEKSNQDFVFWNWPLASRETCSRLDGKLGQHFQCSETMEELLENDTKTGSICQGGNE